MNLVLRVQTENCGEVQDVEDYLERYLLLETVGWLGSPSGWEDRQRTKEMLGLRDMCGNKIKIASSQQPFLLEEREEFASPLPHHARGIPPHCLEELAVRRLRSKGRAEGFAWGQEMIPFGSSGRRLDRPWHPMGWTR